MKNYKTMILPIISVIALGIGAITGHTVSSDIQNEIADIGATVLTAGISIWGIIKSHVKKEDGKK